MVRSIEKQLQKSLMLPSEQALKMTHNHGIAKDNNCGMKYEDMRPTASVISVSYGRPPLALQ